MSFYVGTCTCVGEKLFPVVWDVIQSLELYDIQVVSLSSDGAKPNRRFYGLCQEEPSTILYKTTNPYSANPLHACSDLFCFVTPLIFSKQQGIASAIHSHTQRAAS